MEKLKVGDIAPDFRAKNQHGEWVELKNLLGNKVVLYFYPKDDTPGCTAESCSLRDNYELLQQKGYRVMGVSVDDEKSHLKFTNKYNLPFDLIVDDTKTIVQQYGVWVEKNMYGKTYMGTARTTFLINEKGVIDTIIEKVDTKNAAEQIIDL